MGVIVTIVQGYLKKEIGDKDPSDAMLAMLGKMFNTPGQEQSNKPLMDAFKYILDRPGADDFIRNLMNDGKFLDAVLEHAKPGYGITNQSDLLLKSILLLIKMGENLGKDGFETINAALKDPKQRESLINALKSNNQAQVLAFIKGEEPRQVSGASQSRTEEFIDNSTQLAGLPSVIPEQNPIVTTPKYTAHPQLVFHA